MEKPFCQQQGVDRRVRSLIRHVSNSCGGRPRRGQSVSKSRQSRGSAADHRAALQTQDHACVAEQSRTEDYEQSILLYVVQKK